MQNMKLPEQLTSPTVINSATLSFSGGAAGRWKIFGHLMKSLSPEPFMPAKFRFIYLESRLQQQLQRKLNQQQQTLDWLSKRLQQQHPGQKLAGNARRLEELESRLNQAMHTKLRHMGGMIEAKTAKLWQHNPSIIINSHKQRQDFLTSRLVSATAHKLKQLRQRLLNSSQTLHAVSPLATLSRGYSMTLDTSSGDIIRSTGQLKPGDMVQTRLAQGRFTSQIKVIDPE
jgi:exodeoxyribonuclease VII large subunit